MFRKYILLSFFVWCIQALNAQVFYTGTQPGKAINEISGKSIGLQNNIFSVHWKLDKHKFITADIVDKQLGKSVHFKGKDLFTIVLLNDSAITSNDFELIGNISRNDVVKNQSATKYAERLSGKQLKATFEYKTLHIFLRWSAVLRDSSNYIQQTFTFSDRERTIIKKIILIELPLENSSVGGFVDGSPLIHQNMFFALEHPLSKVDTSGNLLRSSLNERKEIDATRSFSISSAWGTTPEGQLRRGFLYYIERERAAPYHQFLHYNSWFDISYTGKKLNDSLCLDRIQLYADSLITKRHIGMDAFLFDDGWDDDKTLWGFNAGFPDGFKNEKLLVNKFHSQLGVWISPWGGYNEAKRRRLEYGKFQKPPFETNDNGFSLAGPNYYNRFKSVADNFIHQYGIAIFKIDGIGNMDDAISVVKDTNNTKRQMAERDFESLLQLTTALRKEKPSIYLSLTVGTWSSPYWLHYADVTWRSGEDNDQSGKGNERQRWLNYRDKEVYENIVLRTPLYPLNAVMNHGICIADNGLPDHYEKDDKNIADEIWSFFGTGTSLQEMYINPHLLSVNSWNCLATAIKWSRENADIFPDIHWVGGSPGKNEVYGYAAWKPDRGVLTLRNPSDSFQEFILNVMDIFDIPKYFRSDYIFKVINNSTRQSSQYGNNEVINLQPHEVLVLDAIQKN